MKLKTLGGTPADFPVTITVHELDGTEDTFEFTGIGRTTLDWQPIQLSRIEKNVNSLIELEGKLEEEKSKAVADAEANAEAGEKPKKRKRMTVPHKEIAKATEEGLAKAVEMVREFASGWELEDEFTDENIRRLIARYPSIHEAGWAEYDRRIKGERTKN